MLNVDKCRTNTALIQELDELFQMYAPEDIANRCDNQASLLMCLQHGESDVDDFCFLSHIRDTFNRIANILGREPYKPGIDE